jgi:hypothetical protein
LILRGGAFFLASRVGILDYLTSRQNTACNHYIGILNGATAHDLHFLHELEARRR